MKTAVLQIRKEPFYRREAFESGLRKVGYTITDRMPLEGPRDPSDLLVLWNRKRGLDEANAEAWERDGGTVIVAENGYLQPVDKTYYALSVGQHNGAGWFPVLDEDRFTKLGFPLKPWRNGGDYVLVCAQRGIGSRLMASPAGWETRIAKELARITRLPIRVRSHPGNFAPKVPLVDDLRGAHSVVIWSSGSGVRALVEGVPVCSTAPHWVCEEAATQQWIHCDEDAVKAKRAEAMHRMSHGQWHFEEITTGEPFARMADQNWGRSC